MMSHGGNFLYMSNESGTFGEHVVREKIMEDRQARLWTGMCCDRFIF